MNPLRSGTGPPPRKTPEERKNYFYIQSKQGQAVADQYMDNLNSSLIKRTAEAFSENPDANPVAYGLEAIAGGTGSWITDLMQKGSNLLGNGNFIDPNVYELTARLAQAKAKDETLRNVLGGLYTAGQIAPDVASMFILGIGGEIGGSRTLNALSKLGKASKLEREGEALADAERALQRVENTGKGSIIKEGGPPEGAGKGWYKADGSLNLPPNYGAVKGTEKIVDLQPGSKLGRYGGYGRKSDFATAPGASSDSLALPPTTTSSIYQEFTVKKPIPGVSQSTVAEWPPGSKTGGGIQYKLPMTIEELLKQGYIE